VVIKVTKPFGESITEDKNMHNRHSEIPGNTMICEQKRRCWPNLSYLLVSITAALSSVYVQAQTPSTAPLIQSNNLSYIGSFKLPSGTLGSTYGFGYAGSGGLGTYAVTYNPANNSLFIGGHPYEQKIAEVAIPQSLSGTPIATALQNLIDPLEGKLSSINPSDPNSKIIGSAFVHSNQLYLGAFSYYDGAGTQTKSQFVRPTNLSTSGQVQGPFTVGNKYPGWVDKYATQIPTEWQSIFGGQVFVGGSGGAINSLQSWGPSVSAINPIAGSIPATLVLGYPYGNSLGSDSANPYWGQSSVVFGVVFPQGTRSVLFFGKHGLGAFCYGTGAECNDPAIASKGSHNYPYRSQVWAYDANELVAVKNGQKQSWQVQPYAVWELDSSFTDIQGVGYNPVTRRIFVSAAWQDNGQPLIRVYQINNIDSPPPTPTPTPTPTVAISATPSSVTSGSSSTLTWSSTNATSCTASGAWSGTKASSGSQSTGNLTATATYSLTCTGAGGSATQSATVTVTPLATAPTVTISASPTAVISGSSSTLSWSSTNATSCTASGAWSGTKTSSGTQSTGDLTKTSSYTLSCTGLGGSASQSATVTVTSSSSTINVSNISQLQSAISNLSSGQTIVLADGTYNLTGSLFLPQGISNVTIKGASGNRDNVIIKGPGMSNSTVPFGFWADNVNGITFQAMTIRDINQHAIILNSGVDNPVFRNLHIIDIGDQFLKNNPSPDRLNGIDNGMLENSLLEYTSTAPDYYTNGLDVHRGRNWTVRGNTFKNFRSSTGLAGPAILIWNGSSGTTVIQNTFINNQRDISLGLDPSVPAGGATDHAGGLIANNFIYKTSSVSSDVPVAVFDSPQTKLYHNTILVNGAYPNAIEYRFPRTTGVDIKNNLTDASILARDGASASVSNNVTNATSGLFVNSAAGDLHLKQTATAAIDRGIAVSVTDDFDGQARPQGPASDIGADEYTTLTTPPAAPSNLLLQ
jgi:hypothetical protein